MMNLGDPQARPPQPQKTAWMRRRVAPDPAGLDHCPACVAGRERCGAGRDDQEPAGACHGVRDHRRAGVGTGRSRGTAPAPPGTCPRSTSAEPPATNLGGPQARPPQSQKNRGLRPVRPRAGGFPGRVDLGTVRRTRVASWTSLERCSSGPASAALPPSAYQPGTSDEPGGPGSGGPARAGPTPGSSPPRDGRDAAEPPEPREVSRARPASSTAIPDRGTPGPDECETRRSAVSPVAENLPGATVRPPRRTARQSERDPTSRPERRDGGGSPRRRRGRSG